MKHNNMDTTIHLKPNDLTPRELLINILEDEGDAIGWDEEDLIRETAMRLDESPEASLRMARFALNGLLRDAIVYRDGQLIRLNE